jgi:hypothetical protein
MVLFVDVSFKTFKRFLLDRKLFFWCESDNSFIIIKPEDNYFIRTIVYKEGNATDISIWRDSNLASTGGVKVISFEYEKGFLPLPVSGDVIEEIQEEEALPKEVEEVDGVVVGEGENRSVVR